MATSSESPAIGKLLCCLKVGSSETLASLTDETGASAAQNHGEVADTGFHKEKLDIYRNYARLNCVSTAALKHSSLLDSCIRFSHGLGWL